MHVRLREAAQPDGHPGPAFFSQQHFPIPSPHPKLHLLRLKLHTPQLQSPSHEGKKRDLGVCHLHQTLPPFSMRKQMRTS